MIQKLRHKTVGELIFRIRNAAQKKVEKLTFRPDAYKELLNRIPEMDSVDAFLNAPGRKHFFFFPERLQCRTIFLGELKAELQQTIERANRFLQGEFDMLGAQFTFPDRILWHQNPVSGRTYEKIFYQDIKIFDDDGVTDIKHVWEINRHQFFIELAKAYFITREEKYAQHVIDLFEDWVRENPYKIGVNWTSALEVAVRAYSWIWSLFFLIDSPLFNAEILNAFIKNLYLHARFISENLSFYFSPYNHLIGELSALFMLSYLFPEFPEARHWQKQSWNTLESEFSKQFHPDGITVEQATFYHHFTLGFYLMPIIIKLQNGEKVKEKTLRQLRSILEFNMYFTKPDGTFPWIGDIDNARSIYFREPEQWDFRNILAIGAQLFKWPELKFVAGCCWEEVLWLFGAKGWQTYQQLPETEPKMRTKIFTKSGYAVARSHWTSQAHYCWIDFGEIAHGLYNDGTFSAAHGQADVLHFEITANGKNFIVDSGFHNYRGNFNWHRYFRLSRAHNTIEIDQQSQALHGEKMMLWSHAPKTDLLHFLELDELFFVRATHDGFKNLSDKPQHIRNFFFVKNYFWIIWDEIIGQNKHRVDSYLHLNAGTKITVEDNSLHLQLEEQNLQVISYGDLKKMDVNEGGQNPEEGWISPLYRHPISAPRVRFSTTDLLPLNHCLIFIPDAGNRKGQWNDQTYFLQFEQNELRVQFSNPEQFQLSQFFFMVTYNNEGLVFGQKGNQYVLLMIKQDQSSNWQIIQEEAFGR